MNDQKFLRYQVVADCFFFENTIPVCRVKFNTDKLEQKQNYYKTHKKYPATNYR